jgi:hypothetical protein
MGRTQTYSDETYQTILDDHARGMTITAICRRPNYPDIATVSNRAATHPAFAKAYLRAKESFADAIFDEAMQIADDASAPIMVDSGKLDKDGNPIMKVDLMAQKARSNTARLQIDTRLRIVAKINPAKYGDRLDLTVRDEAPTLASMSDADLNARIAKAMRAKGIPEEYVQMMLIPELPPVGAVIEHVAQKAIEQTK